MSEDTLKKLDDVARDLVESLNERGIEVKAIYLFGSYARGDYLKTSDVDLIVVSDSWKDKPFLQRLDIVNEVIWERRLGNLEIIPVTTRELEEKSSLILRDAEKYWVRLF